MNDSATTAGASATATTTDASQKGAINQSKKDQEEQKQHRGENGI
jgi:hypothetical protein